MVLRMARMVALVVPVVPWVPLAPLVVVAVVVAENMSAFYKMRSYERFSNTMNTDNSVLPELPQPTISQLSLSHHITKVFCCTLIRSLSRKA